MMLTTLSTISFTSPLAHALKEQSPLAMSEVLDSVGLADLSGQSLVHVRATNLDSVMPSAPENVGDVIAIDNQIIARLRPDSALIIGESDLESAISDPVLTVTDITMGRGHLLLIGKHAVDVLAKTCGLDFAEQAFPDKHVAQTSVAKVRTTIIRNDRDGVPAYHLILGYSLAEYIWGILFDTMGEFNGKYISI